MLGIHGLAFDQDFIHLAESLPSTAMRTAIDAALGGKTTTTVHEVEADGRLERRVPIHRDGRPPVHPARPAPSTARSSSSRDVSRAEQERRSPAPRPSAGSTGPTLVNRRLLRANDELTALVAELRMTNQSMLQSSEEAQSGREEVETLNEEFQATNEELETLNEELTASVEELRVANEDLAARTEELRLQSVALEEQKQRRRGGAQPPRSRSSRASATRSSRSTIRVGRVATNPAYRPALRRARCRDPIPRTSPASRFPAADWPQQRAARGERFRMEFAVSDPDGTRRWFEAVTEPLTSEDRTWGGVVAIRDVSERTMRLSLERLMAAAGHELKTPTAAIHNYLQLVERHLADGDVDEGADTTRRGPSSQTRRLATLIERLLDVSRIQTGQLDLLLEDGRPRRRRPIGGRGRAGPAQGARRSASRPPAEPIDVRADPGRLEQVFLNLLANAMEHAPELGDDRGHGQDARVGSAEVAVRDHGPGSRREDIRTMFDAYTRLGHPHRAPGLGLGLYVAREIVTAHGGEIEATSRVGKGTVMTVRLPLADARRARGAPARGSATAGKRKPATAGKRKAATARNPRSAAEHLRSS